MASDPGTTEVWPYERALREATEYAAEDYRSAWIFRLIDGSHGWANCHPSWGWLRKGERVIAQVRSNGLVESCV